MSLTAPHPTITTTTTLHLLSLPAGTLLGVDLASFTTTPTFRGIKLLPPGLHHLWISTTLGLRHGFWFLCTPGQQSTFHYSSTTESLHPSSTAADITPKLWNTGLTTYRQRTGESDAVWQELVVHVTPVMLTRMLGGEWAVGTISGGGEEGEDDTVGLPDVGGEGEGGIKYTMIDLKRTWREGAMGRERTEMARDRSWALGEVLGKGEILGEFEVAFVACFCLGNFVSAGQWRRVVGLVLTCRDAAVGGREGWFVEFLEVLRRQLEVLEGEDGGFLGEEVMAEVQKLLRGFGKMLREEEEDLGRGRKIREAFKAFAEWAEKRLDWVLDTRDILRRGMVQTEEGDMVEVEEEGLEEEEERGEYAPAIVEVADSASPPLGVSIVDDDEDDDPRF